VPPFDKIEPSDHVSARGSLRGFTDSQVIECVEKPDHIDKTHGKGELGGFIWKFTKSFDGRELTVVAEVYKNQCYPVAG